MALSTNGGGLRPVGAEPGRRTCGGSPTVSFPPRGRGVARRHSRSGWSSDGTQRACHDALRRRVQVGRSVGESEEGARGFSAQTEYLAPQGQAGTRVPATCASVQVDPVLSHGRSGPVLRGVSSVEVEETPEPLATADAAVGGSDAGGEGDRVAQSLVVALCASTRSTVSWCRPSSVAIVPTGQCSAWWSGGSSRSRPP